MLGAESPEDVQMSLLASVHDDVPPPPPPLPAVGSPARRSRRKTREREGTREPGSPQSSSCSELPDDFEAPKSFFYNAGASESGGGAKELEQSGGVSAAAAAAAAEDGSSQKLLRVRWLGFLFGETAFLVLLQFVLGVSTRSLALMADLGHSSADVICYGVNYLMEHLKAKRGNAITLSSRADLCGCGVSTVLLCLATVSATHEAVDRLRAASNKDEENYSSIGHALLAFAVVSTAANVGTLFLYRRWCSSGNLGSPPTGPEVQADAARPAYAAPTMKAMAQLSPERVARGADPVNIVPPTDVELVQMQMQMEEAVPIPPSPGSPGRARRAGAAAGGPEARQPILNLRSAYSGSDIGSEDGSAAVCRASCCETNGKSSWSSQLHMLVHPGCDGSHDGHQQASSNLEANLNITAAMLHLVADVFRSITILVVGVLIEAGLVGDPGKADALCALLVAVFVAIGSVALVQRMWAALKRST